MTGYDEAVPAGRDLTAQDVDEAILTTVRPPGGRALQSIADYLNRIARPSGGVGHLVGVSEAQPDSDDPPPPHCLRCADGLTTGYLESERDFLREELEKAAAEIDRLRAGSLPAPPPDDVTVVHVDAAEIDRLRTELEEQHRAVESEVAASRNLREYAERLERDVDDMTAAGHALAEAMSDLLAQLPGYMGSTSARGERKDALDALERWRDVEGEPPAPEPQEPPRDTVTVLRELLDALEADQRRERHPAGTGRAAGIGTSMDRVRAALAAAGAERVEEES